MKREWLKKAGIVFIVLGMGATAWLSFPGNSQGQGALKPEEEGLYPTSPYGWLTYYMHEVWERYAQAKAAFDKKDMALADANLEVMVIFTTLSKNQLPDKLQDGKTFDKAGYVKSVDQLNTYIGQLRTSLKSGKWSNVPAGQPDPVMKTCLGCHQAYNIPTDFRRDSQFKKLTHIMHEIYEVYRQAGTLLQQQKWDPAKSCFVVLLPYIELIPQNIPQKNQDGEAIDKALFTKAYTDLKQFTTDIIKKLETKSWQTGKPLPPPRIVVDNCYACHSKVVKIPSPW